ncbi:hypothetical protein [Flavobacterium sp. N1846]|uniref:hypothetical protein n=1 Tax=Flavobacterium sp. N1846 TaxID=2986824 RepID=UPI002225816E|nr:hypothetical protein [Flavobacterium sp. N1846]
MVNRKGFPIPGSLILNVKEVEIRSDLENEILSKLKSARFSTKIIDNEKQILHKIIQESISFIESDNYIEIAKNSWPDKIAKQNKGFYCNSNF